MGDGDPNLTSRSRASRVSSAAKARVTAASRRGQEWVDRQEPVSFRGVAIGAWRRYRAVEGPLQSALLSLYFLVAVLPALLVMEEYLQRNPSALATQLVHHFGLSAQTADLLRGVLVGDKTHELGSALLAIGGALIFGLGLGRVLQIVHSRAWGIDLPRRGSDQILFAVVLLALYGLILLLLVQLNELAGDASWLRLALAPGWVALLICFFVWAPWMLTHKLIPWRSLLPGAVLTALALVVVMLLSSFLMEPWVDLYARDYGGFGVVMAIYFWLAFSSAAVVWAASISPPLAERRRLRALSEVPATRREG